MNTIAKLFSDLWAVLKVCFETLIKSVVDFSKFIHWALMIWCSLLIYAVTYIYDAFTLAVGLVSSLQGQTSEAFIESSGISGPIAQGFAVANAIFPLTEAFGLVAALMTIYMLAVTIRIIKGWIPTMN